MFVRDQAIGETVEHTPGFGDIHPTASVTQVERVLAEWFGAEVILTSSGRAAILLYLTARGFDRYRDRIAVPRMISSCVLDAVIRRGFPVDVEGASRADATLLYHQYGIPQVDGASECALEDICHAFFSSSASGARRWRGEVAVFSLPKFFRVSEMGGGLVMARGSRARQLRGMRDEAAAHEAPESQEFSSVLRSTSDGRDRAAIEQLYLWRLLHPQIFDHQTGGMPTTMHEIRNVGERRREILLRLLEAVGQSALPSGWYDMFRNTLPFALPVFGGAAQLLHLEANLAEVGVIAGIYRIDVARNMTAPRYERAVLLPCHQEIPSSKLEEMVDILKACRLQREF